MHNVSEMLVETAPATSAMHLGEDTEGKDMFAASICPLP